MCKALIKKRSVHIMKKRRQKQMAVLLTLFVGLQVVPTASIPISAAETNVQGESDRTLSSPSDMVTVNNTDEDVVYTGDWSKDLNLQLAAASEQFAVNMIDSSKQDDGGIEPGQIVYQKESEEAVNGITVKMPTDKTLLKVTSAGQELIEDIDYTIINDQVVISPDYLKRQILEQIKIKFIFDLSAESSETVVEMVNDDDPAIEYDQIAEGVWKYNDMKDNMTTDADYGVDFHTTHTDGASLTYRFLGTGISFLTKRMDACANVEVYIDDVKQPGLYPGENSVPSGSQVPVFSIADLPYGEHTIKIVKANKGCLHVDAFAVSKPKGTEQTLTIYLIGPSSQAPYDSIYDKNSLEQTLNITLPGNGGLFLSLHKGKQALTNEVDYVIAGDTISLLPAYLNSLPLGEQKFIVKFDGDYNNDLQWVRDNGMSFAYTFEGSGVTISGPVGPDFGSMEIYMDNEFKTTVDAYNEKRLAKQKLFTIDKLEKVPHTIKVVKTGGNLMAFDALIYDTREYMEETVPVTSLQLNKTKWNLLVGAKEKMIAAVAPETATDKKVTWSSSDAKIVSVDAITGAITAVTLGQATITATSTSNPEITASGTITVTAAPPQTIAVSTIHARSNIMLAKGKAASLQANVMPVNATNKKLTYKSSNPDIITVSNTGVVTGRKGGQAAVTITAANGKRINCTVTVAEVKLNTLSTTLQVKKSTTLIKPLKKYPVKDKIKTYTSSNKKVATVSAKGKITAKKVGNTTITVTMASGATATCKLTVRRTKVVTKALILDQKATVKKGKAITLTVARNPITATEKLSWTSSNKKIATVKNGKVKGLKRGRVKITVKSSNGKKKICTVTVK
jgi:uncharacterized protein YjdB